MPQSFSQPKRHSNNVPRKRYQKDILTSHQYEKLRRGICICKGCKDPIRNLPYARKCATHYRRQQKALDPIKEMWHQRAYEARRNGIKWDINLKTFRKFVRRTGYDKAKGIFRWSLHIDRKRISEGYTPSNIQILCNRDNVIKQNTVDYPDHELKANEPF